MQINAIMVVKYKSVVQIDYHSYFYLLHSTNYNLVKTQGAADKANGGT